MSGETEEQILQKEKDFTTWVIFWAYWPILAICLLIAAQYSIRS